MLRPFFSWNRRICEAIGNRTPLAREHLFFKYPAVVGELLQDPQVKLVVDVGAGKECPFAAFKPADGRVRISGVDIADDEIRENASLDEKLVADVTRELPYADRSVDAVVSRSVLEHLTDLERFIAEAARTLKPGGHFVHFLPNKFALFALVNQALPPKLARKLLYFFWEDAKGICGFPAHYDHTYPTAIEKLLAKHGFTQIDVRVSYYQSFYFGFFLPGYVLVLCYDLLVRALGLRNLAAFILIKAVKA